MPSEPLPGHAGGAQRTQGSYPDSPSPRTVPGGGVTRLRGGWGNAFAHLLAPESVIAAGIHHRVLLEQPPTLRLRLHPREDPGRLVPPPHSTLPDPGVGRPQLLGDRRGARAVMT